MDSLSSPARSSVIRGFIVGMSRSGTSWLTERLDEHPDVSAVGELSFFGRRYVKPSAGDRYTTADLERVRDKQRSGGDVNETSLQLRGNRGFAVQAINPLIEAGEEVMPGAVLEAIARNTLANTGKSVFVEKTPHHINFLDRLDAAFPEARFVISLRDPYGFMLSYKHQGDRKDHKAQRGFGAMYHPIGTALVWRGYVRAAAQAQARYPERSLVVWTREIRRTPDEVLQRVQAFLGLPPYAAPSDAVNSSFPSGSRPSLAPADVFWMNALARKEMRALGVEPHPSNARALDVVKSLAGGVGWAGRVGQKFYRTQGGAAGAVRYLRRWLR